MFLLGSMEKNNLEELANREDAANQRRQATER